MQEQKKNIARRPGWTPARTRAGRFAPRDHKAYPNGDHAGASAAVTHDLKAIQAMGVDKATASGRAAIEQTKALPVADPLYGSGYVRGDRRFIHANRVWVTRSKSGSKGEWDQYRLLATIPEDKAFQPMQDLGCAFAKR